MNEKKQHNLDTMKKRIVDLRKEIDEIDRKMVSLLLRRIDLAKQVGRLKKKHHLAVEDQQREEEIIDRLTKYAGGKISREQLVRIFTPIFRSTKQVQE